MSTTVHEAITFTSLSDISDQDQFTKDSSKENASPQLSKSPVYYDFAKHVQIEKPRKKALQPNNAKPTHEMMRSTASETSESTLKSAYTNLLTKNELNALSRRDSCLVTGFFQPKKTNAKGTFSHESRFKPPVGWGSPYVLAEEFQDMIQTARNPTRRVAAACVDDRGTVGKNITSRWNTTGASSPGPGAYTPVYSSTSMRKAR